MLAPRLVGAATCSAEPALLIDALDVILAEGLLPPDQLEELALRRPVLTQALGEWNVRLLRLMVEIAEDSSAGDPLKRAGALFNLATRLLAAEHYEETLTALALLDTCRRTRERGSGKIFVGGDHLGVVVGRCA